MAEHREILINLLERDNKKREKLVNSLAIILVFTIIGTFMGVIYHNKKIELSNQQHLNSNLRNQIQHYSEELGTFKSYQEMQKEIAAGKEIMKQLATQKKPYVKTMEYFAGINHTSPVVTAIKLQGNTAEIEGFSNNNNEVINYAEWLLKNENFSDILNLSTTLSNNRGVIAFHIAIKWEETE